MKKLWEYTIMAGATVFAVGLALKGIRYAGFGGPSLWQIANAAIFGGVASIVFAYIFAVLFVKEPEDKS